jgi:small subunit ribosomal protein S2
MRAVDIYVRCIAEAILDAKGSNTVGGSSDAEFVEVVEKTNDAEKAGE